MSSATAHPRLSLPRLYRLAVATLLAVGMLMAATLAPAAAGIDSNATYVVNLAGINVATVGINFRDNGKAFSVSIGADVSGVGSLVASGSAEADAFGKTTPHGLAARQFDLMTKANGEDFSVGVQYAGGNATGFQVNPPVLDNNGRIALERKHLKDVADPIASFILSGKALDQSLCDRNLRIFTGMERFDLNLSFAEMQQATSARTGYQGPVVLCRVKYVPISGHFADAEDTAYLAQSDKILIWYAPLGATGYFIPYRVILGTEAGDLSMVLTRLDGV